ncbi:MAG: NADH-quinone oxidoreductase subunit NuoG [Gammaproteobacteria bacterium]|nr:NADH-quinone oxidoreductase subunit NuoG [Gammaproteobacteria bacterium]
MATIRIDDRSYEVEAGRNLLEVALSGSIDLPYFCWHPELGSVGACRQCAVMQYTGESDETGRLVMACMTPVADGMRFSVEAPHARDFRASIIEWLMVNHPHDCPVCEEGGECHLQDMTVMTGHSMRVYPGPKRTWRNQYLGPLINHEMNRCITCYRCVRFYRDYAGGTDLEDFGSRDRVYFGRAEDGVLENEFSGNLVEVCPTGVFTDRPFARRYTRKWDLVSAPSVCAGCALGCATLAASRDDEFRRIHNRYHPDVNRYFLCDRGRFGQDWVDGPGRIRQVGRRRDDGSFDPVSAQEAIAAIGATLGDARVIGIGSPRASLETSFALARLVGREHFCAGFALDETEPVRAAVAYLREGRARIPTLAEVESADAVLVLGEDPIDSAPRLALSLRQAVMAKARETAADAGIAPWQDAGVRSHGRYSRHPLYLATLLPSRSADLAADCYQGSPAELAGLGESIADGDPQSGSRGQRLRSRCGGGAAGGRAAAGRLRHLPRRCLGGGCGPVGLRGAGRCRSGCRLPVGAAGGRCCRCGPAGCPSGRRTRPGGRAPQSGDGQRGRAGRGRERSPPPRRSGAGAGRPGPGRNRRGGRCGGARDGRGGRLAAAGDGPAREPGHPGQQRGPGPALPSGAACRAAAASGLALADRSGRGGIRSGAGLRRCRCPGGSDRRQRPGAGRRPRRCAAR